MTGRQVTAASTGRALRERYPDGDVTARHVPGGVRASVSGRDCGMYVSVGDEPGILAAWLGLGDDDGPHGDGGEELRAAHAA